jgi:hypothetical protein
MANNFLDIWEQAVDDFGSDIGLIVEELFLLDGIHQYDRVILSNANSITSLTNIEQWVAARVGLPQWTAPHLHICLKYDVAEKILLIAERDEIETIIVSAHGHIVWINKGVEQNLNSNLLCFFKSLVLYKMLIAQALLIAGSDARVENNIPKNLIHSFVDSLDSIDFGFSKVWLEFTGHTQ